MELQPTFPLGFEPFGDWGLWFIVDFHTKLLFYIHCFFLRPKVFLFLSLARILSIDGCISEQADASPGFLFIYFLGKSLHDIKLWNIYYWITKSKTLSRKKKKKPQLRELVLFKSSRGSIIKPQTFYCACLYNVQNKSGILHELDNWVFFFCFFCFCSPSVLVQKSACDYPFFKLIN